MNWVTGSCRTRTWWQLGAEARGAGRDGSAGSAGFGRQRQPRPRVLAATVVSQGGWVGGERKVPGIRIEGFPWEGGGVDW